MEKITVNTSAILYSNISELPIEDVTLMEKAVEAREKAYAPYSKFNVGCAVLLENGTIVLGSNQENAAYPSGMCAERVAIWKAGADYPNIQIKKIAITASSSNMKLDKPVGPCGACRQSLFEYEFKQKSPIKVIFMGEVGKVIETPSLVSLLPFSFDSSFL